MQHLVLSDGCDFVWVVVSHYLAGDSTSIVELAKDTLRLLDDDTLQLEPVAWRDPENDNLPDESSLFFTARFQVKNLNKHWQKTGKAFGMQDRSRMFTNFHEAYNMQIFHTDFSEKTTGALLRFCRERGILFSALLGAAYSIAADERESLNVTVDTRVNQEKQAGIYLGGVNVEFPKPAGDMISLAQNLSKTLAEKIQDPRMVHHTAIILGGLDDSLIDAGYYAAYDGYSNKSAATLQGMYGLASIGKGSQISELGDVWQGEQETFRFGKLSEVYFLPAFIPNFARMLAVVTIGGQMRLTHACYVDPQYEERILFRAKEKLENLAENV